MGRWPNTAVFIQHFRNTDSVRYLRETGIKFFIYNLTNTVMFVVLTSSIVHEIVALFSFWKARISSKPSPLMCVSDRPRMSRS